MKKGVVILNGFNGNLILENQTNTNKFLKIIYAGTLYPNQNIEVFLKCISEINQGLENKIEIEFIGIEVIKSQRYRVEKISKTHVGKITISPRVSKKELHIKMLSADLLFLTSFDNIQGWYPVKLFEYAKYPSPIILFPSDDGIMDDFIKITSTGYTFKSSEMLKARIKSLLSLKKNNQKITTKKNKEALFNYSRSNQTRILSGFLKT